MFKYISKMLFDITFQKDYTKLGSRLNKYVLYLNLNRIL